MYSCPCGKNRPARDGAKRRGLIAHADELETRNIRSRERRACASSPASGCRRRREPRTSGDVEIDGGEAVRRPGVLVRGASGEISAISNDAVDERDDDEKIADDEGDCTLFYIRVILSWYELRKEHRDENKGAYIPLIVLWPLRRR